jgi:plastocyanin
MGALKTAILVLPTIMSGGCGGGSSDPGPRVLTTLVVTPATATLFTAAPGNTLQVTVVAKDQDGATMDVSEPITFSSTNEGVATVAPDGSVTAAGAGTAQITASLTVDDVTLSEAATVTVEDAPASATVTAPQFAFQPGTVDVSAGGTVTWTFGELPHTVTFISPGAPPSITGLQDGSASRDFPTSGIFDYRCEFHSGMAGTVRVH